MQRQRDLPVGIALFFLTLAIYWPATLFPFVNFDDPWYVTNNSWVMKGLSWPGVKWAATSLEPANWHPLTLMSHMADCSLYGLFAGGHHLTSLLLHAANAVLLWLLLKRLTKRFWPSALVAALFAWHPLNVESVAWIAERKNVLSTFFFILTLWAYSAYAENSHRKKKFYYALALILFALGLAAKSMLVTLPCLLLLLDFWPLRRISLPQNFGGLLRQRSTWLLLVEKIPFVIFAGADSVITCLAQNRAGGVQSLAVVPAEYRLANIPVAYVDYLARTFWPARLCVFYPFPETLHPGAAVFSLLLLALVTFAAWRWRAKFPWLPVGWLWFLGTLVPVIGLVQVGAQAIADRYAYLPLIGIFLIIAFGLDECVRARPQLKIFAALLAAALLVSCFALAGRQLMCWRDSVALFTQAVAVNPENASAQNLLGRAYSGSGQTEKAIECFGRAACLRPDAAEFQFNLGRALIGSQRYAEAQDRLAAAELVLPEDSTLCNLRGVALMLDGKPAEAGKEFLRAIKNQPDYPNAYFNLGKALLADGQPAAALTNFTAALKMAQAQQDAALVGQIAAELKTYQNALTPQSSGVRTNLPNVH